MSHTLQRFLSHATEKAAKDLETALRRLPEEKWSWSAGGTARTALDQVAECALVNSGFAEVIAARQWPEGYDLTQFDRDRKALMADPAKTLQTLHEGTAKLVAVIAGVPDEDLGKEVQMAWGPMSLEHMMAHGYWNMSYHEGQINYIGALVG
ncbi:MAG TPA: DinB family protein [Capsulimonadaceae bacterium]|nr:DinB family protein [Capsulimonadaceae bacterium]